MGVGMYVKSPYLLLSNLSLVEILDADQESFLRAERSLFQNIGRAARHVEGSTLLNTDDMIDSMAKAIFKTERSRAIRQTNNEKNGAVPNGT